MYSDGVEVKSLAHFASLLMLLTPYHSRWTNTELS